MPYGFNSQAAGDWVKGMAGAMFNPWYQAIGGDQAIPNYQADVDKIYNYFMSPTEKFGGAQPAQPAMPPQNTVGPYPMEQPQQPWNAPPPVPLRVPPVGPGGVTNEMFKQPPALQPGGDGTFSQMFDQEPQYAPPNMTDSMSPPPMPGPPPPSPQEQWMMDYNAKTAEMQEAMRKASRASAWTNMGSALLRGDNWAEGLAGMGEASNEFSAGRARNKQYGLDREEGKLDSMYKMSRIREMGRERGGSNARPQVLADGTIVQWIKGVPYSVGNGGTLTPMELNEFGKLHEQAEDNERAEGTDRSDQRKYDTWKKGYDEKALIGPESAAMYKKNFPEPRNPGGVVGNSESPHKQEADSIRRDIMNDPVLSKTPGIEQILELDDEALVRKYHEDNPG